MTKKISIILAALMVLTLFTAVAIAAVNVEVCPTCNQGEMRDTIVSYREQIGVIECYINPWVGNETNLDPVYLVTTDYYTGCNNRSCSECIHVKTEERYEQICPHKK